MTEIVNTLHPQFLGVHALTLFPGQTSASRADMFASEIGQAPPLLDADVRRLQTGMERRFGEFTDMIRMPGNVSVVRVINKRPPSTMGGIRIPFEKTIVYQNADTGAYGCVVIPINSCNHTQFGFDFVRRPIVDQIHAGMNIGKDTILAHSPSLTETGDYKFGINGKIAFLSIPEVSQDGVVISESFARRAIFKGYGVRTLSFGGDVVPLNLYGDKDNYKIFPDIGEEIAPTGLVFAVRRLEEGISATQMSEKSLMQWVDSDKRTYDSALGVSKDGVGRARVTKIEVFHNNQIRSHLPDKMIAQCKKYLNSSAAYYQDLLTTYAQIKREAGGNPVLEPQLHRLIVEAIVHSNTRGSDRSSINFVSGGSSLNEWTVNIHFSYDLQPNKVFKLADCCGGKAVVVEVWPDDRMPVDKRGVRAELIMDGGSIVNRLNPARLTEHYLNGVLDEMTIRVRKAASEGVPYETIFQNVLELYRIMSPKFHAIVMETANPIEHVKLIVEKGFYVWLPTDNPVDYVEVRKQLDAFCPPFEDKIQYKLADGTVVTTKKPVLIADQYFIMLEKIGDDYSAVASPVLQPQGVPGKLTRGDKWSSAGRLQAIRGVGETEMRILTTLTDTELASDLLDIANSPPTHRHVCRTLLTHPTPTNIENILPRDKLPRGNNRVTQQVANALLAGGYEFVQKPAEE